MALLQKLERSPSPAGEPSRLRWTGRSAAGRQAALAFALFGAFALVGAPVSWTPLVPMLAVAGVDLLLAVIIWRLPWHRWPPRATLALVPIALLVVAYGEWHIDTGTGVVAFLALLFAWIGLHHRPGVALATGPVAIVAFVGPLVATSSSAALVISGVGAVLTLALVGELIARLTSELRAANRTLRDTDAWRASLMASFAHDVRGPLAVVTSMLDHLERAPEGVDPETLVVLLRHARRQTDRIHRLAVELLDADRIQGGTLHLNLESVSVQDAIDRVLTLVDALGIWAEVEDGLMVEADPGRLEQMLVNLLTNAQYHGAPPILIHAERNDGEVHITVRDHGPGTATRDPSDGSFTPRGTNGDPFRPPRLGLWLIQTLSAAHGGRLSYRDADPGAAFTLTLPSASSPAAAASDAREPGRPGRRTVHRMSA